MKFYKVTTQILDERSQLPYGHPEQYQIKEDGKYFKIDIYKETIAHFIKCFNETAIKELYKNSSYTIINIEFIKEIKTPFDVLSKLETNYCVYIEKSDLERNEIYPKFLNKGIILQYHSHFGMSFIKEEFVETINVKVTPNL